MSDALDLLDLTSDETIAALDEWHWDSHLIKMVDEIGGGLGMAWYFIAPLGPGAIPILFHYLWRVPDTYLSSNVTTVYYPIAWYILIYGNAGINGLVWIFNFVATCGAGQEVNLWVWAIVYQGLGTLHFLTTVAFFLVAMNEAFVASSTDEVTQYDRELALYIGSYAWEKVMYATYFPSWYTGMKMPAYRKIMKEAQEDV